MFLPEVFLKLSLFLRFWKQTLTFLNVTLSRNCRSGSKQRTTGGGSFIGSIHSGPADKDLNWYVTTCNLLKNSFQSQDNRRGREKKVCRKLSSLCVIISRSSYVFVMYELCKFLLRGRLTLLYL